MRAMFWIEHASNASLFEWRVVLLEALDLYGPLTAAAALVFPIGLPGTRSGKNEGQPGVRYISSERGGDDSGWPRGLWGLGAYRSGCPDSSQEGDFAIAIRPADVDDSAGHNWRGRADAFDVDPPQFFPGGAG